MEVSNAKSDFRGVMAHIPLAQRFSLNIGDLVDGGITVSRESRAEDALGTQSTDIKL